MSKWFDPKAKRGVTPLVWPTPLMQVYSASQEDLLRLWEATKLLTVEDREVLHRLAEMAPAVRLARNLKVTLELLRDGAGDGPLAGLTRGELCVLMAIERLGLTAELRMTAESLFNVYERYQVVLSLAPVFRRERAREQHRLQAEC